MKEKKINLYLINVVATMLILPLACIDLFIFGVVLLYLCFTAIL